jgi:hypothetical protein
MQCFLLKSTTNNFTKECLTSNRNQQCNRKPLPFLGSNPIFFVKKKVEKNKEKEEKYFPSYKRALMISDKISLSKVNSRKNSFLA